MQYLKSWNYVSLFNTQNWKLIAFQIIKGHVDADTPDSITAFFTAYCSGSLPAPANLTDCLISEVKETLKMGVYAGNNTYALAFGFNHLLPTL